jgi:hypothetical protein
VINAEGLFVLLAHPPVLMSELVRTVTPPTTLKHGTVRVVLFELEFRAWFDPPYVLSHLELMKIPLPVTVVVAPPP